MKIPRILVFPILVAIIVVVAFLVGLIAHWLGAYSPQAWGFFTLIGIFGLGIIYVGLRQLWWLVSGKGDYEVRNGLLKRLWNKIFKK